MRRVDVGALLRHLGLAAEHRGTKWMARCPNPAHDDSHPSWAIIDNARSDRHGSHYCHSCKFGGGPWELAAAVWKLDAKEAGERLPPMLGGKGALPDELKLPKIVISQGTMRRQMIMPKGVVFPETIDDWYAPALEYLRSRDVTIRQILRWGLGYAIRGRLRNRVVVPVYTEGELRTYSARAFAPGIHRYDAGRGRVGAAPRRALFGEPLFDRRLDTVTIAEGVWSALALERAGAPNVCALLGSDLTPDRVRILHGFARYIVATDPDDAGDAVARKFLAWRGVVVERLRSDNSPDDAHPSDLRAAIGAIVQLGTR